MGLIMDITENKCEIQRISFETGKFYETPWIIDIPVNKINFRYTFDKRIKERNQPVFKFEKEKDKEIVFEKDEKIKEGYAIKFIAACHDNFVQKYRIELKNIQNIVI